MPAAFPSQPTARRPNETKPDSGGHLHHSRGTHPTSKSDENCQSAPVVDIRQPELHMAGIANILPSTGA